MEGLEKVNVESFNIEGGREMTKRDNAVATMLQALGGIIIAGYTFRALGVIYDLGGGVAFELFLQGLIFGMLLIGFGEVIKLMQGLFNQREPERPVEDEETARRMSLIKTDDSLISLDARNRIIDFYTNKNMIVDDIEAAPFSGYAIVHHDGQRDIVDLNNAEVEILTEEQLRSQPELRGLLE